jgi:GntR family transcriptional regulator/MocR family aminotransferase
MSLGRRLELLDWARETGSWVLEDDYDSEYRYAGRPLASLQGLDAARPDGGRVLYVGSFSKVLFPSLRLGYLVVPRPLTAAFAAARGALDDHPAATAQPALAAFIEDGHFAAHVRRMRTRYHRRQQCLLNAAERHLDGLLELQPDESGMHLVARLSPALARRLDDRQAAARAAAAGITVSPLSTYYQGPATRQGLLIGYAAVPEAEIETGVKSLAGALCS